MLISNIEDLVTYICNKNVSSLDQRDKTFLYSLSSQFKKSLALTSNQATLLMKILKEKKDVITDVYSHKFLIENPTFKFPFRVIDTSKTISLITYNNELCISIKFPFDRKMKDTVFGMTRGRYGYEKNSRSYVYPFTIDNLYNILNNDTVKEYGFSIHQTLKDLYVKILKIKEDSDLYKPLLDYDDGVVVRNSNKLITKYFDDNKNDNVMHDVFLGKTLGLTPSKKLIEKLNSTDFNQKFSNILLDKGSRFSTSDKSEFNKNSLIDFLMSVDHWPIMFILDGDQKLHNDLNEWHSMLNGAGIENNKISVLSRSTDNQLFNSYIKDHQLNNLVDNKTKVVFIKNKIPKLLYKIDFKPKIVISMSTFYVHFSTQKMLDSHPFIMFYTDQSLTTPGKQIATL